jgi:hypothetical protein
VVPILGLLPCLAIVVGPGIDLVEFIPRAETGDSACVRTHHHAPVDALPEFVGILVLWSVRHGASSVGSRTTTAVTPTSGV